MKHLFRTLTMSTLIAILCMSFAATPASAATGPNKSSESCAYIEAQTDGDKGLEYDGVVEKNKSYYPAPYDFDGLDYDEATNTLTITDFTGKMIGINEMGDDLKVKLVGNSKVENFLCWGYGYGGSVTFTGNGTLTADRLWVMGEGSDTTLAVEGDAKVVVFCPIDDHDVDYPTFKLDGTYVSKDAIKASYASEILFKTVDMVETAYASIDGIEASWILAYKDGTPYYLSYEMDFDFTAREWVPVNIEVIAMDGNVPDVFDTEADMFAAGYQYNIVDHQYSYMCIEESITFTAPNAKKAAPKKGDILTYDGAEYKVTTAGTTAKAGAVAFNAPKKGEAKVTIPDSIKVDGITYKVTSISASAFSGNKTVTSVTIGKNVKTINKKAFYNCSKLKTLTIKSTKLTADTVKKDAFKKVSTSCKVTVPSGKADAYKMILQGVGLSTKVSVK